MENGKRCANAVQCPTCWQLPLPPFTFLYPPLPHLRDYIDPVRAQSWRGMARHQRGGQLRESQMLKGAVAKNAASKTSPPSTKKAELNFLNFLSSRHQHLQSQFHNAFLSTTEPQPSCWFFLRLCSLPAVLCVQLPLYRLPFEQETLLLPTEWITLVVLPKAVVATTVAMLPIKLVTALPVAQPSATTAVVKDT